MTTSDLLQVSLYCVLLALAAAALAPWLARVLAPESGRLVRAFGAYAAAPQSWRAYAGAVLTFNALGLVTVYAVLRLQHLLPWNPQELPAVAPDLAFNTAISFVTNTNWQAYSGEAALSYFSQMIALTTQNFVSAGTGIAVLLALARGIAGERIDHLGNFHVDMVRAVGVLLPLSFALALALAWQGVPQNLDAYTQATTLEGSTQVIAQGPAASQIAIKQLGTNGGGFFGVNSAHPFENPTVLSNLLQTLAILALPAALVLLFGRLVGDRRHARALYATMWLLFLGGLVALCTFERMPHPALPAALIDQGAGLMEGKETRFGTALSALWAEATTAASNGSVNAMHDSFSPLGGLVTLFNIMIGEVVFGGVGAGLYGMVLYVILAVFLAGLMVGRTPEYLGKKIETREMLLVVLALLTIPVGIVGFGAAAAVLPAGVASIQDPGPHGLTELLYAYSSATGNNGSAFGGFGANTPLHNTLLGFAMLLGRFGVIIPVLALAGSLAAKPRLRPSSGTFPTHGPLFVVLLIAVILVFGGLTFFPALALGPIAEHLALHP